jgi:hypothetical protein
MNRKTKYKEDLRKHPRVDIHIPAEYEILPSVEERKNKGFFETENISVGGLMFYSYVRLKQGQNLLIHLYVEKNLVEFSARVVWIKEWSNPKDPIKAFAIGLEYFDITTAAIEKINQAALRVVLLQPKS